MLEALIFVVFPFCMVFSAVSDTLSMTIANRVPLLLLGVFLVVAPLTGMAWADIGLHLAAGALLLTVTFALFAFGGMGGGDAKLIAATGVWMGLGMPLMEYLLTSTILGGVLTLSILAFRSSLLSRVVSQNMFLKNFSEDAGGVPYGIALGLGGLVTYPASPLAVWAVERLASQ
ncbi:prepilin peptidase [Aminobacter sp. NyZ550]|jgi:prepilin peptidase CpaA|uniref:Peptidase A24A prepilin type IV n=2 Tax=Aminobacter TaxID=31988 RepID=A0AAC9FEI6_AMIAI|nr:MULTISPECIES: prepilin peptidase [Aminobacter]AMS44402.1 Peptidase A24A prepilin type IV [Aminobacter aminovorans]MBA8908383.1 prepilin peptidase CpaA [Aminobacter ciceronei]MBA9022178.1 prepilin peptidase CpaA [Aminobacter ciceronei]MBB3708782.1 prepilin peptidase CpaA [Aminobacter aminovorans]MRX34823.1 peptidase [Aminobacter sp. MDW-2]